MTDAPKVTKTAEQTTVDRQTDMQETIISEEQAKAAALADANLTEEDVTFLEIKLEKEISGRIYDIEFYTTDMEYDYKVNAVDGSIQKMSADPFQNQMGSASSDYIGIDRAKEIAVAHADLGNAEVQFFKAKLENDDGKVEYEVVFYHETIEYEYTIDAITGEVVEYAHERE